MRLATDIGCIIIRKRVGSARARGKERRCRAVRNVLLGVVADRTRSFVLALRAASGVLEELIIAASHGSARTAAYNRNCVSVDVRNVNL